MMDLVDELRHLSGIKGGMAVSESEYMAAAAPLEGSMPLVLHQQGIFDVLWDKALPAAERIREIGG